MKDSTEQQRGKGQGRVAMPDNPGVLGLRTQGISKFAPKVCGCECRFSEMHEAGSQEHFQQDTEDTQSA